MNVLITGGAGYIGTVLTETLLQKGYTVTVLDKLTFNQTTPINFVHNINYKFIYGDVLNTELLKKLVQESDIIIPLAAIVGFPACKANPFLAEQINYTQIKNIVDWTKGTGKKILYPNTNSGYGLGQGDTYCDEQSPLTPISVYGETKVNAEKYIQNNSDGICFRLATVFGTSPRMRTDLLVNDFVYKAITDKYIVVFEKSFKRNFIHVKDVASVFLFMIKNYHTYKGEIFNVGLSDANLSKEELLNKIKMYVEDLVIVYSDYYEDPDKRNYIVSNNKVEQTGWHPEYSIDFGIKELIRGYEVVVPLLGNQFKNGLPLGYTNN